MHDAQSIAAQCLAVVAILAGVIACESDPPSKSGPTRKNIPRDAGADAQTTNADPSPLLPLRPEESYAGRTLAEWADGWVRWSNAPTDCEDIPAYDVDGSWCGNYQDPESPIFFLQSGDPDTVRTQCIVPAGKALLVPLVGFYLDGIGRPKRPDEAQLTAEAGEIMASIRDLSLSLDGATPERPLTDWIVQPVSSDYDLPPGSNVYSCFGIEGEQGNISPSIFTGAFVIYRPLEAGMHTIEYGGTATAFGADITTLVESTFKVQ